MPTSRMLKNIQNGHFVDFNGKAGPFNVSSTLITGAYPGVFNRGFQVRL